MGVRVRTRVRVRAMARVWLGLGLRGGAHLDEVAGREEVDREEHDEVHGDVRAPRRDDLRRAVGVGISMGVGVGVGMGVGI